jgi:hypothetical protein
MQSLSGQKTFSKLTQVFFAELIRDAVIIRIASGKDQRPPPGIPPPTLRFSLSSSPESVPVHDMFIP